MKKVYLVRAGQFYKIGISGNINKRLSSIQTGCPLKCKYVGYVPTNDPSILERQLHLKFQDFKTYGEWFDLGDDRIKSLITDHGLKYVLNPFINEIIDEGNNATSQSLKKARSLSSDTMEFVSLCEILFPGDTLTDSGKDMVRKLIKAYSLDIVSDSLKYLFEKHTLSDCLKKLRSACRTFHKYGRFIDDKTWSLYFNVLKNRDREDAGLLLTYILENGMDLRDDWRQFSDWVLECNEWEFDPRDKDYTYINQINFYKADLDWDELNLRQNG